jgi:SAM-dependent methyltransferase
MEADGATAQRHWEKVWSARPAEQMSWFEPVPTVSLDMIVAAEVPLDAHIVDIGGGASTLADALLDAGYRHLTVVDLAAAGLDVARERLGRRADQVEWVVADVRSWRPSAPVDCWHDRAVLHFLLDLPDRDAYVASLRAALSPAGVVIIGTFAPDGPTHCSGLPVVRYDSANLATLLGPDFTLSSAARHAHRTPSGAEQSFQYATFRRAQPHG